MPNLPTLGESTDTWGRELNAWLLHDHNPDGTHKRLERKPKEEKAMSMDVNGKIKALIVAQKEAKRFMAAAGAAYHALATGGVALRSCPKFAAARRASMDLTRALAQMRR